MHAQSSNESGFELVDTTEQRIRIPFELINNLVIIEIRINGSEPLKFVLDTGVGTTLITGLPNNEELYLKNSRIITLAGLGENEPMQAYLSKNNSISLKGVEGENLDVVFLLEDVFNLSSFMGTFVHGLIGYDLFANFAVEIDYKKKHIFLYEPESYKKKFQKLSKHRKWHKFPILIDNQKPYLYLDYLPSGETTTHQIKLLIDSGASNAFSFYETTEDFFTIPASNIQTLLGIGLSGNVNGKMGRVNEVSLGKFIFDKPVVAFPDSLSVANAIRLSDRNGSVGGEILRRFKVIFHYQDGFMLLRSNNDFKDDFNYNMSGIEIYTPIPNLPLYVILKVRKGSSADVAGIREEDIINRINGTKTEELTFNDILNYLESREGSSIRMEVQRDSTIKKFFFRLRNELKVD
ncbi:MAG: aspartyl protease family protein [Balneolaceae bacterium]